MSCRSMNCYKTVGKDLDRIPITEMMKTGGIMFKSNCANSIWNKRVIDTWSEYHVVWGWGYSVQIWKPRVPLYLWLVGIPWSDFPRASSSGSILSSRALSIPFTKTASLQMLRAQKYYQEKCTKTSLWGLPKKYCNLHFTGMCVFLVVDKPEVKH